jgi:fused signal recognition particle receptor
MVAASFSALAPFTLFGLDLGVLAALGAAVIALIFASAALWRRRRSAKAGPALADGERPSARPAPAESAQERERRAESEAARERAAALGEERSQRFSEAARSTDASRRAELEAEARALKAKEEEEKRVAYRADKAAEHEARGRRAAEEGEARRKETLAQQQADAETARLVRTEAEARLQRVAAEGGRTLAAGLERTKSEGFVARLNTILGKSRPVDAGVLAELEEALFGADIGVRTAARLVEAARTQAKGELTDTTRIKALIEAEVARILAFPPQQSLQGGGPPHVVMVVGVNGAGKTTTIGKLAARLTRAGKRVVLAAGDTFRAAATEQLDIWAERAGAELVKGAEDSDPGAVVYDAVKRAVASGADVVLADTAGRLHTKAPLMEELKKIHRVLGKALPGAPHEVLLVLDATVGQNAIAQALRFREAVGVTSIVLTKLDGTAKGGVIIGIADELRLPVSFVGVGEQLEDLRPFSAEEFVKALFAA